MGASLVGEWEEVIPERMQFVIQQRAGSHPEGCLYPDIAHFYQTTAENTPVSNQVLNS